MNSVYSYKEFKESSHDKIINLVDPGKKVLDVGCASGYIASVLKRKGCYVVGIDNDKADLEKAKEHCDETKLMDVNKDKINGKYDVIILGDILEHLHDPVGVLQKLRANLNKDGYAVLSVPNIVNIYPRMKILFGRFDYEEKGIFDKTHLRFFTLNSFKRFIRDSGFSVVSIEATPIPIYLALTWPKSLLNPIYYFLNKLAKIWPTLFGYQFVAKVVN